MQVLGRHISKWWLLALPPLIVVLAPALLMLFFMGNNFVGAIVGPPAIWSRPWHPPARADLAGTYVEVGNRAVNQIELPSAMLTLGSDGSMKVADLPLEGFGPECDVSGSGRWLGPSDSNMIVLNYKSDEHSGSCSSTSLSFLEVTGHSKPYGLYWVIGDPDSGTGVWLKRSTP